MDSHKTVMYRFKRMKKSVLMACLVAAPVAAFAVELPLDGLTLNPRLGLTVRVLQPPAPGQGFLISASNSEYEVIVKGVPMKSRPAADQMARVELANIKNLYNPRGNPYEGQISDLIECQKEFMPKLDQLIVSKQTRSALTGGVNGRKLFGACTRDQIEYWGGYFNLYDEKNERSVDVRVFAKAHSPKPSDVVRLRKQMNSFLDRLLVEAKP